MSLRHHCKGASSTVIGQDLGWANKIHYEPLEPWQPLSHGGRQTNPAAAIDGAAGDFAAQHRGAEKFSKVTCEALAKLAFFRVGLQVVERHRLLTLSRGGSAEAAALLERHASPYPNM